ncbi:NUDIX domain-containing protein [Streptomyces sp. NPDC058268]|uniref:NUDIX hydrolase n=1 Tax=Streptomyces sp. NPDC058268 TaxID=3346413 RepID=UPI0036E31B17
MTTPSDFTGTAALLVNSAGQYLLHLRDNRPINDPFTFCLLGGGPKNGESPQETIARELKEETGLVIPDLAPFQIEDSHGRRIHVFVGHFDGDAASIPLTEGILVHWFDYDKLPDLRLARGTQNVIDKHRATLTSPPSGVLALSGNQAMLNVVGAHLYLERDGNVLLGKRSPTAAYAPDTWHTLAGHVEAEAARACMVREAKEEARIILNPADLELAHVVHMREGSSLPRLQLFFRARRWSGEPYLNEPDRCTQWRFWDPDALPSPLVDYTRVAIDGIRAGRLYSEMGWTSS